MPHTDPLLPDDPRRFGVYRPIGRLGVGGQGVVYLAESPDEPGRTSESQYVAVKALHGEGLGDSRALARMSKEVAAARRVASFCTARVVDADLDARPPYVVSEYIEGPTLLAQVSQDGPLKGSRLIRLAVGAATALTAIHQHGVVHRDFKPGNIILGPDGPRVIDFGIARQQAADATGTTGFVGTPVYMAPEHFLGTPIGPAADVFAWASTMVYAATGRGPFAAASVPAVMNRIINDEPTIGDLPEPLAGLVDRCLNKDPEARPTSRDVLLGLLADSGDTVSADIPVYAAASRAAQVPFAPPPPHASGPGNQAAPGTAGGGAFTTGAGAAAAAAAGAGAFGTAGAAGSTAEAGAAGAAAPTDPRPTGPGTTGPGTTGTAAAEARAFGIAGEAGAAGAAFAVPPPAYGPGPQAGSGPQGHYGDVPYGAENPAPAAQPGEPLLGPTPIGPPDGFPSGPQQAGMPGPYGGPNAPGPYSGPTGPDASAGYGPGGPGAYAAAGGAGMYGTPAGPDGFGGPAGSGPYGAGGSDGPGQYAGAPAGPNGPGPYGGAPGGPDGPGGPTSKKRKVLIGALAAAGAVVVLAGAAFFVFGRGSDEARAANGTPQAQSDSRKTAQTQAHNDHVDGHGISNGQQRQKKATDKLSKRAGQKPGHRTSGPYRSTSPTRKPAAPPAPKPNRYTPRQVCGSGYRVLASHPLYLNGARVATVYLLYSGSSGDNCAVTLRSDQGVGKTEHGVRATVQRRGGSAQTDGGAYLWYAGPVRVHAPGKCVRFGGTFTTGHTVSWTSPYGHCG